MATKTEELTEKMVGLRAAAEAIQTREKEEDRVLTVAEVGELNDLVDQADTLQAEIDEVKADEAKARLAALGETLDAPPPKTRASGARIEGVRDRREDDCKHGFRHMGEFAIAVQQAAVGGGRGPDERLFIGAAASGMQQKVGADGGFLVPPSFSSTIWDGMNETPDNLLAMTDNFQVDGESLTFPANAETSRATGSRYGGVQGYWIAEADQITSSKPTLRQIKIEPKQLAVLVYATDKLLKNGTATEQYLTRAAMDEINFMVGDAIVNGVGGGMPSGILGSSALVTVDAEVGQDAETVVAENVSKMFSRLHSRSRANAVWLINQDIEPSLQFMSIGVGTAGQPVYLQPGAFSASPFATLYGRPVIPVEYCQTLGTVGDIILADMKGYVSGTQGGIESGMSIHLRFDYLETAFRFVFAVDGQTWLNSPITPFKGGSNTQSNFVALATRA